MVNCLINSESGPQTTMARAYNIPNGYGKERAWKVRHSGVLAMLTKGCKANGTLSHELIEAVKVKHNYRSSRSIRDLWRRYKDKIISGEGFKIQRQGKSGRKLKFTEQEIQEKVRQVPLVKRKTLRSLSFHSGINHVTLFHYLRRGILRKSTSSITQASH